jgi:polyisoprenoid-binding protein YceI
MSNTQTVTIAPAGTWGLDAVHSAVGFEVEYLGGTFKGSFREIDATLVVGDDAVSLEGSAKVASVDVKDENLAGHLQSPDFFDAERYPEIRFTANNVSLDGETVKVEGDLTIKGITHAADVTGKVSSPLTDGYGRERIGLKLDTRVDRTEFDVNWNNPLPSGEQALANDVTVVAELFFVKAS